VNWGLRAIGVLWAPSLEVSLAHPCVNCQDISIYPIWLISAIPKDWQNSRNPFNSAYFHYPTLIPTAHQSDKNPSSTGQNRLEPWGKAEQPLDRMLPTQRLIFPYCHYAVASTGQGRVYNYALTQEWSSQNGEWSKTQEGRTVSTLAARSNTTTIM
jgi:hypothetical protein